MKVRKISVVLDAFRWFKNGDHPEDGPRGMEGKLVRYFRDPDIPDEKICQECGNVMHVHGWIDTKEGGHIVCPGDWIITDIKGEHYPCKPDIFDRTYQMVLEYL